MHQDGVNSLALALTAAFCGANQHDHGLSVRWALQGEGMALCILVCSSIGIKTPKRLKKHHKTDVSSTPLLLHMKGIDD